jgi:class 3 adenylate cyclase
MTSNHLKRDFAGNLEKIVQEKSEHIVEEKKRAEELLNNILPSFIVDQLKNNTPVVPETFNAVTIMFSDIVGFQQLAATSNPQQIVNLLNDIYSTLDSVLAGYDVYKVRLFPDRNM